MQGCNQTLTVWNRYRNAENKDVWQRFVIPILSRYTTEVVKTVTGSGSTAVTVISNVQGAVIPFTDEYLDPVAWRALGDLAKTGYFTLQTEDLMALGEHDIEITGVEPFREADVRKALRPNVFSIKAVADNTADPLGRHWKVMGV